MLDRLSRPLCTVLLLVSLAGCTTFRDAPQQDYSRTLLTECVGKFPGTWVKRVDPDGQWWITYTSPSALQGVQVCMAEESKAQPYLDWLKARQVSTEPKLGSAATPVVAVALSGSIAVPVWRVGDEWQYAYKSPSDSGTYVWVVNRVETVDGVDHYVVKGGTREIFYRVSDLASSLERVDRVVVLRDTPARLMYAWPLTVGKSWEESHRQERPVDRATIDRKSQWTVEADETVTVPAGTFRTFRIRWKNANTGATVTDMWYAPDVKQWVKIREVLSNGIREREMVSFKLK